MKNRDFSCFCFGFAADRYNKLAIKGALFFPHKPLTARARRPLPLLVAAAIPAGGSERREPARGNVNEILWAAPEPGF